MPVRGYSKSVQGDPNNDFPTTECRSGNVAGWKQEKSGGKMTMVEGMPAGIFVQEPLTKTVGHHKESCCGGRRRGSVRNDNSVLFN